MEHQNIELTMPADLANRIQHWIDTDSSVAFGVIADAITRMETLDRLCDDDTAKDIGAALQKRFAKYRGIVRDTRLSELLDARREGILE